MPARKAMFGNRPLVAEDLLGASAVKIPEYSMVPMPQTAAQRIFVVDDEFVISWSIGRILSARGFAAHTYTNPLEALNNLLSEPPDLLITDVRMPEMSGIELAIKVKLACPHCKVLLLSGQVSTDDLLEQARELGHTFDLLRKPIHPEVLLAAVVDTIRSTE